MAASTVILRNRAAWIVEWCVQGGNSAIEKFESRPYILPYRWKAERIVDFMRCLYLNSSLVTPSEAVIGLNKRQPEGMLPPSNGQSLIYGECGNRTFLFSNRVKDLNIERDEYGRFAVTWTNHFSKQRWFWKEGHWIQGYEKFKTGTQHLSAS